MQLFKSVAETIQLMEAKIDRWQTIIKEMKEDFPEALEFMGNAAPASRNEKKPSILPDYDKKAGLTAKFLYFLGLHKRFVHLREVADFIVHSDGIDPNSKYAKELATQVSASISALKQRGQIVKYVANPKKNTYTYWGLPKWLDSDGKILPEHMYNTDYPRSRNKEYMLDL